MPVLSTGASHTCTVYLRLIALGVSVASALNTCRTLWYFDQNHINSPACRAFAFGACKLQWLKAALCYMHVGLHLPETCLLYSRPGDNDRYSLLFCQGAGAGSGVMCNANGCNANGFKIWVCSMRALRCVLYIVMYEVIHHDQRLESTCCSPALH